MPDGDIRMADGADGKDKKPFGTQPVSARWGKDGLNPSLDGLVTDFRGNDGSTTVTNGDLLKTVAWIKQQQNKNGSGELEAGETLDVLRETIGPTSETETPTAEETKAHLPELAGAPFLKPGSVIGQGPVPTSLKPGSDIKEPRVRRTEPLVSDLVAVNTNVDSQVEPTTDIELPKITLQLKKELAAQLPTDLTAFLERDQHAPIIHGNDFSSLKQASNSFMRQWGLENSALAFLSNRPKNVPGKVNRVILDDGNGGHKIIYTNNKWEPFRPNVQAPKGSPNVGKNFGVELDPKQIEQAAKEFEHVQEIARQLKETRYDYMAQRAALLAQERRLENGRIAIPVADHVDLRAPLATIFDSRGGVARLVNAAVDKTIIAAKKAQPVAHAFLNAHGNPMNRIVTASVEVDKAVNGEKLGPEMGGGKPLTVLAQEQKEAKSVWDEALETQGRKVDFEKLRRHYRLIDARDKERRQYLLVNARTRAVGVYDRVKSAVNIFGWFGEKTFAADVKAATAKKLANLKNSHAEVMVRIAESIEALGPWAEQRLLDLTATEREAHSLIADQHGTLEQEIKAVQAKIEQLDDERQTFSRQGEEVVKDQFKQIDEIRAKGWRELTAGKSVEALFNAANDIADQSRERPKVVATSVLKPSDDLALQA